LLILLRKSHGAELESETVQGDGQRLATLQAMNRQPTISPLDRRTFLSAALVGAFLPQPPLWAQISSLTGPLSKEERDRMSPDQILEELKTGNERFRTGRTAAHDYRQQQLASAVGQYPAAALLGCIDSRGPAEIIFDVGIGDVFNARIAGNVVTDDLIGSLEFACAAAGAKVVVLFGHTACGAVKGAIDDVQLGHLSGLLARIKPAIAATTFSGERSGRNPAFVDAVARTNVRLGIEDIRQRSSILAGLEHEHRIRIVGAMYDLATGVVTFGP
jgi:carbonic anhydrase